jgi:uncharacterized iron-regulated protein
MCLGFALLMPVLSIAQNNQTPSLNAYELYSSKGKPLKMRKMLKSMQIADVVIFGELHNNPIAHWLELEIARYLHSQGQPIAFAAEMFETDQQAVLDAYLSGQMDTKEFEDSMRLWPNYKTDYKPIVEFARENGVPVVASNCPRQAARVVARNGMKSFAQSDGAAWHSQVAPLPVIPDTADRGYREMKSMMTEVHGMTPDKMIEAQALKDATMAWKIAETLKKGKRVFHFNGEFHSMYFAGINGFLKKYRPGVSIFTISIVEGAAETDFEPLWEERANVIIVVPPRMTKTY